MTNGELRCTSDSTGASSTVAISDSDLFGSLTQYLAILSAVPGVAGATGVLGTGGNPTLTFPTTGVQDVTAEVADPVYGGTDTDTKSITVS